jgi:hypothetical protein
MFMVYSKLKIRLIPDLIARYCNDLILTYIANLKIYKIYYLDFMILFFLIFLIIIMKLIKKNKMIRTFLVLT